MRRFTTFAVHATLRVKWAALMLVVLSIALTGIVIWFVLRGRRSNRQSQKQVRVLSPEATAIVDGIKSKADYRRLERQIEHLQSTTYRSDRAEAEACRKLEILQEAEAMAMGKTVAWQLTIAENIDVPLRVLEYAYKVVKADDPALSLKFLGDATTSWWIPLDVYNEPESAPRWLAPLKKFRAIVEGNSSIAEKVTGIDLLYTKHEDALSEIFAPASPLTAGQEWVAQELAAMGLPKAHLLVSEGILTPEDALKIDPDEFASRKGIGPKARAALIAFQNAVRNSSAVTSSQ